MFEWTPPIFPPGPSRHRVGLCFAGSVQGVGFRPTLYRLATELGLDGWVSNTPQGVHVEVEGPSQALRRFFERWPGECPPLARVTSVETQELPLRSEKGFHIHSSGLAGEATVEALPDAAICPDCRREILDPLDRRYRYPFTNCTHCGPRFSILLGLPYDRDRTTMRAFPLCPACRSEYEDPADRRFHAQPVACPVCGPQLALRDAQGHVLQTRDMALDGAIQAILSGKILAVKGLGGFQLICDAGNGEAIARLRAAKRREEKPFALMVADLPSARALCDVDEMEEDLLTSPAAPIVLLSRRKGDASKVHPGVATHNPNLGLLLPTTPLHALLLEGVRRPLVATSGNLTDEPIAIDENEALRRLGAVADGFLVHDRPIARAVDDSVARVMGGRPVVLRRARGYAPRPILLSGVGEGPAILALGAHLKNAVTFLDGERALVGQHIGDLETPLSLEAFQRSLADLPGLYGAEVEKVACDAHPDYASTRAAEAMGKPLARVQHHAAHMAACAAENGVRGEALGVSWDGTGWGPDGTVWGGEFFVGRGAVWTRRGHLRRFPLPGGEAAVREPRRAALGLLYAWEGEAVFHRSGLATLEAFTVEERRVLSRMLGGNVNCPSTSSMGRLFDATASLLGLRQRLAFEGQGAMAVEFAAAQGVTDAYPILWREDGGVGILDWGDLLGGILLDKANGRDNSLISAKFMNALVEGVIKAAGLFGQNRVLLGGGCFLNKYLLESCARRLKASGLDVYWPREVPPNDGGISLGQAVIARG